MYYAFRRNQEEEILQIKWGGGKLGKRKQKRILCATATCTKKAAPSRTICEKCKCKNYRRKYPLRAIYRNLKNNAKRRHKEFTITYEEFERVAKAEELLRNRGRASQSLSFDRTDVTKGYVSGNVSLMTIGANSRKWHAEDKPVIERVRRLHSDINEEIYPF